MYSRDLQEERQPSEMEVLRTERGRAGARASEATGLPEYKTSADIDIRLSEMLEADARAEREREERRIQRKQIAESMSDLGAMFGDVIKASGGALVTPRDVRNRYDQLDAQSQQVYANYRARMGAMRDGLVQGTKSDLSAAAQRAAAVRDRDEERAYTESIFDKEMKARKELAGIQNTYNSYRHGEEVSSDTPAYALRIGNELLPFDEVNGKRAYNEVYGYMVRNGVIPKEELPNKTWERGLTADDIRILVDQYMPYLTAEQMRELYKYLTGNDKVFTVAPSPLHPDARYGLGTTASPFPHMPSGDKGAGGMY